MSGQTQLHVRDLHHWPARRNFPRWVAYAGYASGAVLIVVIANWRRINLLFPVWILLLGSQTMLAEFRAQPAPVEGSVGDSA